MTKKYIDSDIARDINDSWFKLAQKQNRSWTRYCIIMSIIAYITGMIIGAILL
jgi:hypothetical protein